MNSSLVPFDSITGHVVDSVASSISSIKSAVPVYLVRDLLGKVRIAVSDDIDGNKSISLVINELANKLYEALGPHAYSPDTAVLYADQSTLDTLSDIALEIDTGVYWVDRLVTCRGWWTVGELDSARTTTRYTLFSIKGGVGRSTTAAVLAMHLANSGESVMVIDLDLESPGLSSALLEPPVQPQFGVTDWFVEDLVGQGKLLITDMVAVPHWSHSLEGDVWIVPAHGYDPGEYLAKLGRVYMEAGGPWTDRLQRLLTQLELEYKPNIVLIESRSGLHDLASATVTDIGAQVIVFATDSESTWVDYEVLFRHWQKYNLATKIRERLSFVSALTPELHGEDYLRGFRERVWKLYSEYLYDEVDPFGDTDDLFSFDIDHEDAPHIPIPILWTRGLAAGTSLRNLEKEAARFAYSEFLETFDNIHRELKNRAAQ